VTKQFNSSVALMIKIQLKKNWNITLKLHTLTTPQTIERYQGFTLDSSLNQIIDQMPIQNTIGFNVIYLLIFVLSCINN